MVFAAAIDTLFGDPAIAADALYTPVDGSPALTVRVIAKRPDEVIGFGDTRLYSRGARLFDVRRSDVNAPVRGDRISYDGADYIVQGEPDGDVLGQVWALDTRPAP